MTLKILAPNDPALNALQAFLVETPSLNAEITIIAWEQYRDKLMETLQAETPEAYMVCIPGHVWLPELAAGGYLAPLEELAAANSEALAAYRKDDLMSLAERESHYKSDWYMCPLFSDGHVLFYHPQHVSIDASDGVPRLTTQQIAGLAAAGHDPPQVYGIALKAHPSEIFLDFLPFLWEAGADVLGADGRPDFNNDKGIAALELYCSLKQYAPDDTHEYGNAEIADMIKSGRAALATTWGGQAAPLYLPQDCGYKTALYTRPWNATWGLVMPANVPHEHQKDVVGKMLQMTAPAVDKKVIEAAGSPVRTSSYMPEHIEQYPWLAAQQTMLQTANMLPLRPETGQFLGALYEAVYDAFTGKKTPAEALAEAEKVVQQTL